MSDELERLKADLEVLRKYTVDGIEWDLAELIGVLETKARKLEAEADPWRDVKEKIDSFRSSTDTPTVRLIAYIDHLNAENARLTERVVELEAAAKAENDEDLGDAEEALANLKAFVSEFPPRPPFEGPIESIEPVLDPARVLATAVEVLKTIDEPDMFYASNLAKAYQCLFRHSSKAEPYKLKGGEE